ncbi:MAG: LuxR C-terminal-related transcriptional regulator [Actinomycetota bacterium]
MRDEFKDHASPPSSDSACRVLVVDDDRLLADAVAAGLAARGYDVTTAPLSGDEALREAQTEPAEVVLVAVGTEDGSSLRVGAALLAAVPGVRVVALSDRHDPAMAAEAIRIGFRGYVKKDTEPANLALVVETVRRGETLIVDTHPGPSASASDERDAQLLARQLTPREREILSMLVEAVSSSEIASRLSISPHTVRTHVQGILQKLQVHSRIEAAGFALRHRLVGYQRPVAFLGSTGTPSVAGTPSPTHVRSAVPSPLSGVHRDVSTQPIRIVLAHHRSLVVHGLRSAIAHDPQLRVLAEARDAGDLRTCVARARPDVVVLDLSLPGGEPIEMVEAVKRASPASGIVVLDGLGDAAMLRPALAAGADAYLTTTSRLSDVLASVKAVNAGGAVVGPELLAPLLDRLLRRRRIPDDGLERLSRLSRQEREVLRLLAGGSSRAEIARRLGISTETARTHLKNVRRKLGVHSRLEAAAFALQPGIRVDLWNRDDLPASSS